MHRQSGVLMRMRGDEVAGKPSRQRRQTVCNWPWTRVNLTELLTRVAEEHRQWAERVAGEITKPEILPGLGYTESSVEWILLRKHAGNGQIRPEILRRMRDRDLEYLAGDTSQIVTAEDRKVAENAARARRVLAHRSAWRTVVVGTVIATAIGSGVATLITLALT